MTNSPTKRLPRPCEICKNLTRGSVGAAGLFWPMLCQPCKDREDKALLQTCISINAAITLIYKGK